MEGNDVVFRWRSVEGVEVMANGVIFCTFTVGRNPFTSGSFFLWVISYRIGEALFRHLDSVGLWGEPRPETLLFRTKQRIKVVGMK